MRGTDSIDRPLWTGGRVAAKKLVHASINVVFVLLSRKCFFWCLKHVRKTRGDRYTPRFQYMRCPGLAEVDPLLSCVTIEANNKPFLADFSRLSNAP